MSVIDDAIAEIEEFIIANGNEEITADVLRPLLVGLGNAVKTVTGDPANLDTLSTNLVEAINEVLANANGGIVIRTGTADPNVTPPLIYNLGDFYARSVLGTLISFWQYNGIDWVQIVSQSSSTVNLSTTIDINSLQLYGLETTPIELIPAPGIGKLIALESFVFLGYFESVAYDFVGTSARVSMNDLSIATISVSELNSVSDIIKYHYPNTNPYTVTLNSPLVLDFTGTPPTVGDGTAQIIVKYKILEI